MSSEQNHTLRVAIEADAVELQGWFNTQYELRSWAGPKLQFGVGIQEFKTQLGWCQLASFSLVDEAGLFLAFGQYDNRLGYHHLCRLCVNPNYRGQGIANTLIQGLVLQAKSEEILSGCSLFVLKDNQAAINCYLKNGFEVSIYPEPIPEGLSDCLYMRRDY